MSLTYLPADLPEDWKSGQILAPSGGEVGLRDQYGFNYLMKSVNDAHRACNALLDENQRLREELAGKVTGNWRIYESLQQLGIVPGEETIPKIAEALPNCSMLYIDINVESLGHADIYPVKYGRLEVVKTSASRILVTFRNESNQDVYLGNYYYYRAEPWMGWTQTATAVPPQPRQIPFVSGVQNYQTSEYFKTQENVVHVFIAAISATAENANTALATLPAGFRPSDTREIAACISLFDEGLQRAKSEKHPVSVVISPNGDVKLYHGVKGIEGRIVVFMQCSYLAAQ